VVALGDKEVRGLDVAVDDPLRVGGVERVGNLDCEIQEDIGLDGFLRYFSVTPSRNSIAMKAWPCWWSIS
jgi:hypothetical protein